ncbi:unnamed protein product [Rhodiola kirilowii]
MSQDGGGSRCNNADSDSTARPQTDAPENALTHFALRLAFLEKTATGLGTLGFIWATVVLLGGFAITLDTTDFWFITIILVIEGTRIFSRSHELEWQHRATWSNADSTQAIPPSQSSSNDEENKSQNSQSSIGTPSGFVTKSTQAIPPSQSSSNDEENQIQNSQSSIGTPSGFVTKSTQEIPPSQSSSNDEENQIQNSQSSIGTPSGFVTKSTQAIPPSQSSSNDEENQIQNSQSSIGTPYDCVTKNVGKLLYWLQLFSAITCIVLSLIKLIRHDFGHIEKGDTDKRNRKAALYIFYSLALAEASLFVLERVYWEWTAGFLKLLEKVNNQYELGPEGMVSTRRFFYDAYSKSINGSVFESLRMDMISFSVELLKSNSPNEQLIGARLLRCLSTSDTFAAMTLRKIGVDICVIERLVEMLNWRNPSEQEIRQSAAEILVQVASQQQNSSRIAEIPGAVESVASLLQTGRRNYTSSGDEICQRGDMSDLKSNNVQTLNNLGLQILNELSCDHDNCGKIGNTRGLLPKIIDFTYTPEDMFTNPSVPKQYITTVSLSLQLVKMLVSAPGISGGNLRKEISEIVFTIRNVRNILKNGIEYPELRLEGIKVLTNLGLEDDATDKIGGTGGVLKELLNIFFSPATVTEKDLINAAGDAIAMLTLESKNNCHRVLQLEALEKLVNVLEDEALCINAARILRNLCIYTENARFKDGLRKVVVTAPMVLEAIMSASDKQLEVMTGLALYVFKYMEPDDFSNMFKNTGHSADDLATRLVQILKNQTTPSIKVPRIRRFAIELAIWMMHEVEGTIMKFRDLEMEKVLMAITETTTDVENFHLFSGTVGVSRHTKSVHSLVDEALFLVAPDGSTI